MVRLALSLVLAFGVGLASGGSQETLSIRLHGEPEAVAWDVLAGMPTRITVSLNGPSEGTATRILIYWALDSAGQVLRAAEMAFQVGRFGAHLKVAAAKADIESGIPCEPVGPVTCMYEMRMAEDLPAGTARIVALAATDGPTHGFMNLSFSPPIQADLSYRTGAQFYNDHDFEADAALGLEAVVSARFVPEATLTRGIQHRAFGWFMGWGGDIDETEISYSGPDGNHTGGENYHIRGSPSGDYVFRVEGYDAEIGSFGRINLVLADVPA